MPKFVYIFPTAVILVSLLLPASHTGLHAQGLTLYVAPNGSDAWSGKWAEPKGGDGPFASIVRARDAIRELKDAQTAIPALHAAALEPELVASLCLRKMIPDWREVVHARETQDQLINVAHGALGVYDLPDLERMYGVDRITVEQPVDVLGRPLERTQVGHECPD